MKRISTIALAGACASILAGCSGGGSKMLPTTKTAATTQSSSARLQLLIPGSTGITAKYVSPSTKSVQIKLGSTVLGSFDTTPSSTGCSSANGGTQCAFAISLPAGSVTLTVSAFDQTGSSGNLLSSGTVTQSIAAGQNTIAVTMGGQVASVSVAVAAQSQIMAGVPGSFPIIVMAKDAAGNVIVGPGNYSVPITLTDTDLNSTTTLSKTTVSSPSDQVTLTYNGDSVQQATIGASAQGIASSAITGATFSPAEQIIQNFETPRGGSPVWVTFNPVTKLIYYTTSSYVGSPADTSNNSLVQLNPATGAQTEYDSYTNATVFPSSNNGGFGKPAVDAQGNVWVGYTNVQYVGCCWTETSSIVKIDTSGTFTSYALPAGICPGRMALGVDKSELWFTNDSRNTFCPNQASNEPYGKIDLTGNVTMYALPSAINQSFDVLPSQDGNLYISGFYYDGNLWQVPLSGSVPGTPVAIPLGLDPQNNSVQPFGIAQTADGDLWFTQNSCNEPDYVGHVHNPGASATVTYNLVRTSCDDATYMATTHDGQVFFGEDDFPTLGQVVNVPGSAPVMGGLMIPSKTYGESFDTAVGPQGHIWFTNRDSSGPAAPGNLGVVAY